VNIPTRRRVETTPKDLEGRRPPSRQPAEGGHSLRRVIRDSVGNLYGTSYNGGAAGLGAVYKVNTSGQLIVLHNFTGGTDGQNPHAGVVRDSAGNLYGTTENGGTAGVGVVFKVSTGGNESVMYAFTGGTDGAYPYSGLLRATRPATSTGLPTEAAQAAPARCTR
jgi:uncharacterized repeat protein (TIGR03803 family)